MSTLRILDAESSEDEHRSEICIVGAGAGGCYLARRLADTGRDVVVLEAGGASAVEPEAADFIPVYLGEPYPGASEGRSFGLGGSTARWGGLLVPHSRYDLRPSESAGLSRTWKSLIETVEQRGPTVLETLGYVHAARFLEFFRSHESSTDETLAAAGLGVVSSVFLPFRKKNLRFLLETGGSSGREPRLITGAAACSWRVADSGHVQSLSAKTTSGRAIRIHADRFVVAAGAVESARILLEIHRDLPAGRTLSSEIGLGLGDHLSVAIADVEPASLAAVTKRFGPRFEGPWMRSFRFMEKDAPSGSPRYFSHFVFENENPGFALAKKVLTAMQARRRPRVGGREVLRGLSGAVALATDRYARSRLHLPPDTPARLQIDVEQLRSARNRIALANREDGRGRDRVSIDWRIRNEDVDTIRATAERLLHAWSSAGRDLPRLIPRDLSFASEKPHDAYHPVGVCRMGDDPESVVDPALRVRGLENVHVLSTAVLPSAGTANPTFTMLCLAEALAGGLDAR